MRNAATMNFFVGMKPTHLLRILTCTNWGADQQLMIMLYRSFVRSRLEYGCIVYFSPSDRALQMLDAIHHTGLHISTGAFHSNPVISLCAETGEPQPKYCRSQMYLPYLVQILAEPNHPFYNNLLNTFHQIESLK